MICATMKQYADFVSQFSQSVSFELRPKFTQLGNRTGHGAFQTIATSLGDSTRIFGEPIKLEKHNFSLKPEASLFLLSGRFADPDRASHVCKHGKHYIAYSCRSLDLHCVLLHWDCTEHCSTKRNTCLMKMLGISS